MKADVNHLSITVVWKPPRHAFRRRSRHRDRRQRDAVVGRGTLPVAELLNIAELHKLVEITLTHEDRESGLLPKDQS